MLIIFNDRIVEGIKINSKGLPIIPNDILLKAENNTCSQWPYIYIPSPTNSNCIGAYSSNHNYRVQCEIGYWDNINLTKRIRPIILDNVSILSIIINLNKQQVYESSRSSYCAKDIFKYFYHYEITLEIKSTEKTINLNLTSDDYLEINYGSKVSEKVRTMKILFESVIPMLNNFVSQAYSLDLINKSYIQGCFPNKDTNFTTNQVSHSYYWFKQIIYSAKIKHIEESYILEFGEGMMNLVNHHIAEIISDILGVRFLRESNDRYIYGIVTKLLDEIDNNDSLLLPYCMAKVFFNAERFYSSDTANKELLLAVSSDVNDPIITHKITSVYCPTNEVVKMFDFIFNLKAEHKIKGTYRAGRDDYECEYESFIFPLRDDFTPSYKFILMINSLLNIKLEIKEANKSILSSLPRRYEYTKVIDSGYVSWLARDEDRGSAELQKSTINMLFDKIYQIYLLGEKDFYNLLM